MSNWLDSIVNNLKTTGSTDLLAFVESNYLPLLNIGFDSTSQALALFNKGDETTAQLILDMEMGPDDLIAMENENAMTLNDATRKWESFKAELKSFALSLAPVLLKVGMSVATGDITAI